MELEFFDKYEERELLDKLKKLREAERTPERASELRRLEQVASALAVCSTSCAEFLHESSVVSLTGKSTEGQLWGESAD